jgi:hypothetical protein
MTIATDPVVDSRPSGRAFVVGAVCLLVVSIGIQVLRDRGWHPYQPATPILWVQSGPLASRLALGFKNLVADIYWMRAVVYYGGQRRSTEGKQNYDLLYPLLDLVTSLDPRFRVAYRFGAIFLAEAYPAGPGRPDLAIALLKRGLEHQPSAWEYAHDIGFVYYWSLHDYETAATWFDRGAALPGAPSWLKPLAAMTLAQGGNRQTSRQMWLQIAESGEVEWIRRSAEQRLLQLDAMDMIDRLNVVIRRFAERHGRPARHWEEVIASERLRGIPLDPTHTPFVIVPETGEATVARSSPLWPLPTASMVPPGHTP